MRTLRRYDEQGLLLPALVDPGNGRRYYSPAQAADARLIRLLRDIDLPLNEVRQVLAHREQGDAAPLLAVHRDRLARQLAHQLAVLDELDTLLADPRTLTAPEVLQRRLPEQLALTLRVTMPLPDLGAAFGALAARLHRELRAHAVNPAGPMLSVYHGDELDPQAVDVEIALPIWHRLAVRDGGISQHLLPAAEVAATLHAGPYHGIGSAYRAIAAWSADAGHTLGTQPRETYLVGPDRAEPDGLRTEVAWPLLL